MARFEIGGGCGKMWVEGKVSKSDARTMLSDASRWERTTTRLLMGSRSPGNGGHLAARLASTGFRLEWHRTEP